VSLLQNGRKAKDPPAEQALGNGMRTRSKGLHPQRTHSLHGRKENDLMGDNLSADEAEASPR